MDVPDCHVLRAASAAEAAQLVGEQPVQLIIVDIHEPWVEGLEMIRQIRAAAPHAPLIALGLDETEAHRDRAAGAGAGTYICKSTLQADLIPAVRRALARELA
jgi:DNA-binding NarL/FixJ family response regulator